MIVATLSGAALFALAAFNASSDPHPLRPTWVKGTGRDREHLQLRSLEHLLTGDRRSLGGRGGLLLGGGRQDP